MKFLFFISILSSNTLFGQIIFNNGAEIIVNQGSTLISNGGIQILNGTLLNDGFIQVTRLSNYSSTGNFIIDINSLVYGNGIYKIEQDWINNGVFYGNSSTVELYGDLKQLITSNNSTQTNFHNLLLTGNGLNNDRKKELISVNCSIDSSGILNINDRELSTNVQIFHVKNPSTNSVLNNTIFQQEGFISSIDPGYFYRNTYSIGNYFFPFGSSSNFNRYRPVILKTLGIEKNKYGGRLNNYLSDIDNFNVTQKVDELINLNSSYYHTFEKSIITDNKCQIGFSFLNIDGEFNEIGNWNQSNEWVVFKNDYLTSISNYLYIFSNENNLKNIQNPFILAYKNNQEDLYIPNTFTPDNGNYNNTFKPIFNPDVLLSSIEFIIYNRWGEIIHNSSGLNIEWDGKINGVNCQDGTYVWTLQYIKNNKTKKLIGHVNLLR